MTCHVSLEKKKSDGCMVMDTLYSERQKYNLFFKKSMYFCGKISRDMGIVESSGLFLFDRSLLGKSFRGGES